MNEDSFKLASAFVSRTYAEQAFSARHKREKLIETLLSQRRIPDSAWDNVSIELFLSELACMDSNNFIDNVGVGERESRIFSDIVSRRHFHMGHGIGRSGDLCAIQPKAAGSSLIAQLTRHMALDAIKIAGIKNASACVVLPLATGMALAMSLLTLKSTRPKQAKFVLWPRMDQKTCLKAIYTAGLEVIVVENRLEGDEVRTDLEALQQHIERIGADNIVAVVSTSSCFTPRIPDRVVEISKLCRNAGIGHIINNAYGIQCAASCELVAKAGRVGRVDCFVQSLDKNFMVPIGGSVVAAFEPTFIDAISKNYPGRASISSVIDLFITLLSMGANKFKELLQQREELMVYCRERLSKLAEALGERLLVTPNNPISMGISLTKLDAAGKSATYLGSMLFSRFCSGVRVVSPNNSQKICNIKFPHYGSHLQDPYPCSYLTVACGIGMQRHEIDIFCVRMEKAFQQFMKQMQRQELLNQQIATVPAEASNVVKAEAVCLDSSVPNSKELPDAPAPVVANQVAADVAVPVARPHESIPAFIATDLDRSFCMKTDSSVVDALSSSSTRFLIVHSKRVLHFTTGDLSCVFLAAAQVLAIPKIGVDFIAHLCDHSSGLTCALLGKNRHWNSWLFAVDVSSLFESDELMFQAFEPILSLSNSKLALPLTRALLATADPAQLSAIGRATALLDWHRTVKFCGTCGSSTIPIEAGTKRRCSGADCRARFYPRTDVVAIALVIDTKTDRVLLGRSKGFKPGMFSTLAGFIEQCESIEDAVRREVFEETGVTCGRCSYHSSQPWPIGRAGACELMVGMHIEAVNTNLDINREELEDARWFTRDEIRGAHIWSGNPVQSSGSDHADQSQSLVGISIPGPYAIAHHLIQQWLSNPRA